MAAINSHTYVESLLGGVRRLALSGDLYDFVIIGGGTAGLVLANRLSADPNVSVIVLEAGECLDAHPRVKTPALYATLLDSDADWSIVTEPQEALNGRKINLSQGRALGGSSAINTLSFVPTSKSNLDAWAEAGNTGWDWDTLAPYLKKSHTFIPPTDPAVLEHLHLTNIEDTDYGTEGLVQISYPDESENPLPQIWIETLEKLGHGSSGDVFHGDVKGAFTGTATISKTTRERSYSASAYLNPVKNRPNVKYLNGAHVLKIELTGSYPNVIAHSVQYTKDSQTITVRARKEVILSAGALHSPKILELSGIGNPKILKEFGIRTVIDNPSVGENLQDHATAGLSFEVREGVDTLDDLYRQDPVKMQEVMKLYAIDRAGPLAAAVYSHALVSLPKDLRIALDQMYTDPPESTTYELQTTTIRLTRSALLEQNESSGGFHTYAAQGNYTGKPLKTSDMLPGNYYTIAVTLLQPASRGSTHIQSSEPSTPPKVDPRYLSHPLDLEYFAHHTRFISQITSSTPLKYLLKTRGRRNEAAPSNITDLDTLKSYLQDTMQSSGHPTSTCAMLPEDQGGVVDPRLKVWGAKNLRIVDASVFPITTRGNPLATVYSVAERAADIIIEDSKSRQ